MSAGEATIRHNERKRSPRMRFHRLLRVNASRINEAYGLVGAVQTEPPASSACLSKGYGAKTTAPARMNAASFHAGLREREAAVGPVEANGSRQVSHAHNEVDAGFSGDLGRGNNSVALSRSGEGIVGGFWP
jgi:hypothetical protein